MRTSTALKYSKLLPSLRSKNPKPQACFLHLQTEKPSHHEPPKKDPPSSSSSSPLPSSSPIITQIADILKSNDNGTWKTNDQLTQLLSSESNSLSSRHLVQIARHLENSTTALNFVEHLRSSSCCPDGDSLSFVFEIVFELAGREPNWEEKLLELFKASKELNVPLGAYSATFLIRSFGRAKMVDKSMLVYEELDTHKRNCNVRNVLIDELFRSGRFDDALQVLDEMFQQDSEFLPNETTGDVVFAALMKCEKYDRGVSEEEIVELVSKLGKHRVFPDSFSLSNLITKFCRKRRIDMAWKLFHAVMELDGHVEIASCNALLTGLGNNSQFKKMNLLMKEMKEKGILPNVITFGISINHLCKSHRLDEAMDLLEKMREGKVGVTIEPDLVMYNTLIDGFCRVGRVQEGMDFMRRMKSENKLSPSTVTYNCLIDGLCRAGELEKAIELFHQMSKEGVQPNVVTVNTVVNGMCRHGKAGGALDFYREMKDKGLDGNKVTYTALISGFCGVNNINKALELFNEMKEKCTPDIMVYYALISGLSQAGRMDVADSVLAEMRSAGFQPDIACYNVMINGHCKRNWLHKAYELLKDMGKAGVNPDSFTYNTLIAHCSKTGDLKLAHKLLKQMIKDDIIPTVVTYGALIHACCSVGKVDEAMKIFQDMRSSTRIPPNTVIYNTLINSLCQNKKVKDALSLFDDMKFKEVSPNTNTFNSIFKALKEENWLEKALELMDRMVEEACNPDYITLEILTEWLPGVGHTNKMRRFLQGYKVSSSTSEIAVGN